MFRLKLTAKARKELKVISKIYKQAIGQTLEELKQDPFIGKPLTRELTGKFSCKIGVFRIIYKVGKKDKIVHIITVGHRATVYE